MPLLVPNLDDRTFEQLVTEGRSLIPRYSKEWTNHNPSDPGITLLELFAWLTETAIFQLNQVPDASIEHFLKLVDVCREGTAGKKEAIDQTIGRALEMIERPNRAITDADFEAIAQQAAEEGTLVVSVKSGAKSNLTRALDKDTLVTQLIVKRIAFQEGERVRVGSGGDVVEVTIHSISDITLTVDAFQARTDYPTGTPVVSVDGVVKLSLTRALAKGTQVNQLVVERSGFQEGERIRVGSGENVVEVTVRSISSTLTVDAFQARTDYPEGKRLGRTAFTYYQDKACAPPDHSEQAPLAALVIVVPDEPDNPTPTPSMGLTDMIFHRLTQHRLLTTRVHVVGPQYVEVTVDVTFVRKPGSGLTEAEVKQVILDFLHPLRGGFDGKGWQFGRAVYKSEMFQRLEKLPKVDHVENLKLDTKPPGELTKERDIKIPPLALVFAVEEKVKVTVKD